MKNTELKIGNYVQHNDEIIKVEQITKRKIGYHRNGDKSRMHYLKYSEIKPIEITEDILIRLGFEETFDDTYPEILRYDKINVIKFDERLLVYIFNKCIDCHFSDRIKYIHELQNAYYVVNNKELHLQFKKYQCYEQESN